MLERTLLKRTECLSTPLAYALATALIFALLASGTLPGSARADKQNDSSQAIQTVFTNASAITIPSSGPGSLYPSPIVVAGVVGNISPTPGSVKVTLNNFSHTFPDDVGMVLVGPTGAALNIMDGPTSTMGGQPASSVTLTLSDTGATRVPNDAELVNGTTYQPGDYYADTYQAPGPGTSYNSPPDMGAATFSSTFAGTNPNGTWNLYIADFVPGDSGALSGGWSLEIISAVVVAHPQHVVDYDGDGKTDPSVLRNTGGGPAGQVTWFSLNSGGTPASTTTPWGILSDGFVPEDYDGDNKTDIAVWRPGAAFNSYFYILQSQSSTLRIDQFGQTGDDPKVVGDYDGDGKCDTAVYRDGFLPGDHSFWYYRSSVNGLIFGTDWGQNGDHPAPGDYDGDGRNDFVVRRSDGAQAIFYFKNTTSGLSSTVFGTPTDVIVPGDYDGDGKTDLAVSRSPVGSILWFIRRSTDSATESFSFGLSASDFRCQGDWDGDGKTDVAVWRQNADPTQNFFYWRRTSDGIVAQVEWGQSGDYPVANYNQH